MYVHIRLPPRLGSPTLGRGSDMLPGPPSIPRAPGPLGFSKADPWLCHSPHTHPCTPRHNSRCSNSRQRPTLPSSLFFFSPPFSLFLPPSFLGLFRTGAIQGKYKSAKARAKRLETRGILRRCFLLRGRRGKPATNKSLLQFVKATSSSCAKASRAENHFLNKLVRLLFGRKKRRRKRRR